MIYSNRLKYLREEKDLKLREIDKILELNPDTYGKFETEKTIIPIIHLNKLSNFFDVSLDYIFEFTDEKKYANYNKDINSKLSGERLKEFRKENNLTQDKLADVLNTLHQTISNYEKNKSIIATPFLYDICKKYNISADYLLGKVDTPKYLIKK